MPRAAGSGNYYTLKLLRAGGEIDPDVEIRLPSVTHIIHATLAATELVGWAYRQTLESVGLLLDTWAQGGLTRDEFVDAVLNEDLDAHLLEQRLRPEDVRDIRADEGTHAHAYLDLLAHGKHPSPSNPFESAILDWWQTEDPTPEASEQFVYSLKHGYAGTLDLVYWSKEGRLTVMDLKTRASTFWGGSARTEAYYSDRIQTTAYAGAWEEMTGMSVTDTKILLALDDGRSIDDSSMVKWEVWEALKVVYDSLPERSKR